MTPAAKEGLPAVVGELVAKWRRTAKIDALQVERIDPAILVNRMRACADELEATLLAEPRMEPQDIESKCFLAFSEEDGYGYNARHKFSTFRDGFYAAVRVFRVSNNIALSTATPAGEWVLVPRNPSNNMQIAGLAALDSSDATPESIGSLIGYKAVREAYRAMLAASPRGAGAGGEL
jgi:hypothetical protein